MDVFENQTLYIILSNSEMQKLNDSKQIIKGYRGGTIKINPDFEFIFPYKVYQTRLIEIISKTYSDEVEK